VEDIWDDIIQSSHGVKELFEKLDSTPGIPHETSRVTARRDRWFVPPLPWRLFCVLAPLPGSALAVYLILYRHSRREKCQTMSLTSCFMAQCGITRWQKERALVALEKVGLIVVKRTNGKNPLVTLRAEDVPWVKQP
jgi:hypothetical protein